MQVLRFRAPILIAAATAVLAAALPAIGNAQNKEQTVEERTRGQTRKTPALREPVYKKLNEAQELAEAKKYKEALAKVSEVKSMKDLNTYERAQMHSFLAYIYFTQDNYAEAIRNYEAVLQQPDIPVAMEDQTRYTLSQLYFQAENYKKSIQLMQDWLKTAKNPGPEPYMVMAQAYYQLEDYRNALPQVEKGIAIAREQGKPIKENWLLLERLFYYELKDYKKTVAVLEELITRFPKKDYWLQLAGMYGELDKDTEQLAAYRIAHRQGFLTRSGEYVALASLSLQAGAPWAAAQVMEEGFKKGAVEKTAQNYRLLANAYTLSQEDKKALGPLTQAARLSNDGELDVRLGQAYLNLDQYDKAVESLRKGLSKGGIRNASDVQIMLGMSLFELKQYDSAKQAFATARNDKSRAKAATQWLQYIESEEERQRQLRDALKGRQKG
jgi:tetratricopeptide (TPR) repeat protein